MAFYEASAVLFEGLGYGKLLIRLLAGKRIVILVLVGSCFLFSCGIARSRKMSAKFVASNHLLLILLTIKITL